MLEIPKVSDFERNRWLPKFLEIFSKYIKRWKNLSQLSRDTIPLSDL
jgi:hypothetical protein